jgi:hypothetical protein
MQHLGEVHSAAQESSRCLCMQLSIFFVVQYFHRCGCMFQSDIDIEEGRLIEAAERKNIRLSLVIILALTRLANP